MTKLVLPDSNCWIPREMQHRRRRPKSQTAGHTKRADTCQLRSVGGLPRKAWVKARAHKLKNYKHWIAFTNKINGFKEWEKS